jgi:serine/threonine protein kinase
MQEYSFRISNRFGYSVAFNPVRCKSAIHLEDIKLFLHSVTSIPFSDKLDEPLTKPVTAGSFSQAWIHGNMCCRFTRSQEGLGFLTQIIESLNLLVSVDVVNYVHAYGYVVDSNGNQLGLLVIMDSLMDLPQNFAHEEALYTAAVRISEFGFHNDFKLDNIMQSDQSNICVIDFDLFSPSKLVVALSGSSFIELDLDPYMQTLTDDSETFIKSFRFLYDYTYLSLSINRTHPLYEPVLKRLLAVFRQLESTNLLSGLIAFLGESRVRDIPVEVLVRCPEGVEAVSVNIFDIKGNAFAHGVPEWDTYPSLFRSTGVYWPDR